MTDISFISEKGSRRENEDCTGVMHGDRFVCAALADGLGGHLGGATASHIVIDSCLEDAKAWLAETEEPDPGEWIERAQSLLLEGQKKKLSLRNMKSTLCLWVSNARSVRWAHIGDSRIYHFRNGKVMERTLDHSVPQILVQAGQLEETQIRHHPDRNRVLRCMGMEWTGKPYVVSPMTEYCPGDAFLLCSDGFWENIPEEAMEEYLYASDSAAMWIRYMKKYIQNQEIAGLDNYSAIGLILM